MHTHGPLAKMIGGTIVSAYQDDNGELMTIIVTYPEGPSRAFAFAAEVELSVSEPHVNHVMAELDNSAKVAMTRRDNAEDELKRLLEIRRVLRNE